MGVAIYVRTSTEEQTPELQIEDCKSINQYGDAEIFIDKQSAWKDHVERDNFNDLKKQIKKRKINHIIVWDLDRLYRNRKNLISFFKLCKSFNCQIHSFRQDWLENLNNIQEPFNEIMHDLMLQIMGWLAEEESSKKSQRVKLAVDRRGKFTRSKYGNKWGRKEISTQKINKILILRKQSDKSIREIAREAGVSIGVVHKIISGNHRKKQDITEGIKSVN